MSLMKLTAFYLFRMVTLTMGIQSIKNKNISADIIKKQLEYLKSVLKGGAIF
jgi:hypothetical protein